MTVAELTDFPLQSLKQERVKIASALSALDSAIRILEGNQDKPMDWKNNALNCIKGRKYPMKTVDILNCLFFSEPEKLKDDNKRRNYTSALSIALNNLCDKGTLDRLPIAGQKGFCYGLSEWFVTPGILKVEYADDMNNRLREINSEV